MALSRFDDERFPLAALLLSSALVFAWDLDVSGTANVYYSAAAQAGAESWKAMFFGSLDAANAVTVDKPPFALWPMDLSVRMFGLTSWSVLLPQAVEGVACVAVLYACVRRSTGAVMPAVLAGVAFTLTPVVALVFRYNNPDAMLTLLLVGAGYATLRSLDGHRSTRWIALAGALCGLGFLTKMLEGLIVVPALALTFLVHGRGRLVSRLGSLTIAGISLGAVAGWWVAIVALWPVVARPFIGGSSSNSIVQLAWGYNGVERITGSSGGGLASSNLDRIGRTDVGTEVMWLVPAAVILGGLAWTTSRERSVAADVRAGLTMWTSWFVTYATTFAVMAGIFHSYYTVVLAPPIAAVLGTGAWTAWKRRNQRGVQLLLVGTTLVTSTLAVASMGADGSYLAWTAAPIFLVGLLTAALAHARTRAPLTAGVAVAMVVVALLAPAVFVLETIRLAHVGSGPMAGPGHGAPEAAPVAASSPVRPGADLYRTLSTSAVTAVVSDAEHYTWAAAAMGARSAAAWQVATGRPVMAIGGYKGTDPIPTLTRFQALAWSGRIHWLIPGGTYGPAAQAIEAWVAPRFRAVSVDGRLMYDLSDDAASNTTAQPSVTAAPAPAVR